MLVWFLSPKGDGFSFILIEPQRGDDGGAGFVWVLAHRGKPTNTSSQDEVVIRMKGSSRFWLILLCFSWFLFLAGAEILALQLVLRRRRNSLARQKKEEISLFCARLLSRWLQISSAQEKKHFVLSSLNRNFRIFGWRRKYLRSDMKRKTGPFSLHFAHLFVSLQKNRVSRTRIH